MKKPEVFTQSVRVGVIAVVASSVAIVKDYLFQGPETKTLLFFVVLILSLIISRVIEQGFELLFEKSGRWRSFLLGKNNVEGLWVQRLTIDGEKCLGVLSLYYSGSEYSIHGWRYNPQGEQTATWKSLLLKYEGNELNYLYQTRYPEKSITQFGYSTITFIRPDPTERPDACNGHFLDLAAGGVSHTYRSVRLDQETTIRFSKNPAQVARELFESE